MTTNYRVKDPFPDEFHQAQYPILEDGVVPRPRLAPDLEQKLYHKFLDKSDRNSQPWLIASNLNCILPAAELLGFAAYLKAIMPELIEHEKTREIWDPMPQPPEIMHGYLQFLFEKTSRRTLKRHLKDKFDKVVDYNLFLGYRITMRKIACARLKKELKDRQDKILEQETNQVLSSMMLPAHVMEKASGVSPEGSL